MNLLIFRKYIGMNILILVFFTKILYAAEEDTLSVRNQYKKNLKIAAAEAVKIQKKIIDSLSNDIETSNQRHQNSLRTAKDSLLGSIGKSLDKKRIESVKRLYINLSSNLNSYGKNRQKNMHERLQEHQKTIDELLATHLNCSNCNDYNDFEYALNSFQTKADHSVNAFFDSASNEHEKASDALQETAEILHDSLTAYIETLADERSSELEEIEEHSNKIVFSVDAKSHTSYRGRDGGISQAAMIPSVALALNSGLRFTLSAAWTEKPDFHRDGTYFGVGYNFNIFSFMGASIGYTYLSYTDSSTQNQSVFSHSVDGSIYFESSLVNLGGSAGISIGDQMEYVFAVSFSRTIPIGNFSLDPSLTVTWGEQNGQLTSERLTKTFKGQGKSQGKGKGNGGGQTTISEVTTTFKNIFTLMAYEINLPLNISLKRCTITPSVSAVIPMNVNDGSREEPFINAGLTVVYELTL